MSDIKIIKEDTEFEDVRDLHIKFRILNSNEPSIISRFKLTERRNFMQEELDEFRDAATLEEMADALVDLVYVAKGTAVMMGLPWAELWADVQRANMSKVRGVGKRGNKVDLVKPPGWHPPETKEILDAAGFNRKLWLNEDGTINEEEALDE